MVIFINMENEICSYGCGKPATNQLKNGKYCCSKHPTQCEVNRLKNGKGLKKAYKEGKKVTPFLSLTKEERSKFGKLGSDKRDEYYGNMPYKFRSLNYIREDIFLEQDGKCNNCGLSEWLNKPITLELEHKDGDNTNDNRENLELICPNCHSQTETWKGRNKNTSRKKVSDEDIIKAYEEQGNIRRCLISVGLSAKGGNYARVKRLIK